MSKFTLEKDHFGNFIIKGHYLGKTIHVFTNRDYVYFMLDGSNSPYQPTYSGGTTVSYAYRENDSEQEKQNKLEKCLKGYLKYLNERHL